MNRRITRVLSVLLTMSMMTAVLPFGMVSAEEDVPEETEAAEEVEETEESEEPEVSEVQEEPEDEPFDETVEETTEEITEEPDDAEVVETAKVKTYDAQPTSVTYDRYWWDEGLNWMEESTYEYTIVTSDTRVLTDGTYVVNKDTTISERVKVSKGDVVNLVVLDGVTLTCKKGIGCGLDKNDDTATLNIFGTGKIVATGSANCAGIGGDDNETSGNISIHDTTVEATGGKHAAGIGGGEGGKDPDGSTNIIIFNATVTATGGIDGAGIGGGDEQPGAHTYIYGGDVTASSTKHGAGIGGGDEEGTLGIYIFGGKVTATGGEHGAGIGAGEEGGNMRSGDSGAIDSHGINFISGERGGVNILGGNVTATGGSGAAGIGGGYNEDMSGDINIAGYSTVLKVYGGTSAAGIGAGNGNGSTITEGDMKGIITINCGADSDIEIFGGDKYVWDEHVGQCYKYGGAGIGAGYTGNMPGTVYLKRGNIHITSGSGGAGIGGGMESNHDQGGEGGNVYVGGGNISIKMKRLSTYKNKAIGSGSDDSKVGSVYINYKNNDTGRYMRVDYTGVDQYGSPEGLKTALAGDRSSKCHGRGDISITECDHKDCNGKSGLSYTIDDAHGTHTKKCKFCGLEETASHSSTDCECGYSSGINMVQMHTDSGVAATYVSKGSIFDLPDNGNVLTSTNSIPQQWSLITGWSDITSGQVYEPGESVTVDSDLNLVAVKEKMYLVDCSNAEHGSVSTDLIPYEGDMIAAPAGAEVGFDIKPDIGYCIDKLYYTYGIALNPDCSYQYHDPIEIAPDANGVYELEIPGDLNEYANGIVISATFKEDVTVSNCVVQGASVTLGGELGLNFYVNIPDSIVAAGAKAVLDGPEGAVEYTLSDMSSGDNGYKLTYSIKAIYMNEDVAFTIVDKYGEILDLYIKSGDDLQQLPMNTMELSIYDYVAAARIDPDLTTEELNMVNAMYTYGAYSVKWKFDTAVPSDVNSLTDLDVTQFEEYKVEVVGSNDNITITSISLLLDSNTALRLYFTCSDDISKHEFNLSTQTPLEPKATGTAGKYYVEVDNIPADSLTVKKAVMIDDDLGVRLSPMSYIYHTMNNGTASEDTMNVLKAFKAYSDAARAMI